MHGRLVLAKAGLLTGRRATTHWSQLDRLSTAHPDVRVERGPIFTKDGKFYTTAGVSAGIDLALALVEEDLGRDVAAAVARNMVLFLRRSGNQAQFSTVLAQQEAVLDTRLRELPAWVSTRLHQPLDIATMSQAVAMAPRTFARQFAAHFRTTPARWLQALRVGAACQHLESTDAPLKSVASRTGFRDEHSLRRAFMQRLAISPREYRERFGGGR